MLQVATNNSNIKASKEQNKKLKGNLGGSNMKLQLALDDITLEDAVELLDKVHPYVDIIEVGSPFIIEEGMRPVRIFKEKYPDCEILADTKIMDAGEYEAEETFKAGADYCTVLGVTDTLTIEGCVKAAKEYGKQTMVDMIGRSAGKSGGHAAEKAPRHGDGQPLPRHARGHHHHGGGAVDARGHRAVLLPQIEYG